MGFLLFKTKLLLFVISPVKRVMTVDKDCDHIDRDTTYLFTWTVSSNNGDNYIALEILNIGQP